MNQIEFMFVLLNKWYDKVAYGSTDDVKKMYSDYCDYCSSKCLISEKEENLIYYIEKCKYEELPISTRHDIYRAAQVALLDEMTSLRYDKNFARESIELLSSGIHDVSKLEALLFIIRSYLDHAEEDDSIDVKLKNHKVKWDSSVG